MNDQLDKELSKRIHDVFDVYDDPFSDANWQALVHKRKKVVWINRSKWMAMAAALAVLTVFGVKLLNTEKQESVQKPVIAQSDTPKNKDLEPEMDNSLPLDRANETTVVSTPTRSVGASASAKNELIEQQNAPVGNTAPTPKDNVGNWAVHSSLSSERAEVLPQTLGERRIASRLQAVDKPESFPQSIEEENKPQEKQEEIVLFADNNNSGKALNNTGNFSLGFVTTSLMNYAEGNTSQSMHLGAGITSALKLGNNFSLRSGLILAKNSLSLNQNNSVVSRISASDAQNSLASPNSPATGENDDAYVNTFVREIEPSNVDVDLLVVDIPLNLSYKLNLNKTDLIITGGLSSFVYLDQEYSYYNSAYLYSYGKVSGPEPVIKQEKGLSHFDFAKQLNFAVGTSFPLGKKSSIVIEPYVKYPLGELTSENIRYGSMGLNLRFRLGN